MDFSVFDHLDTSDIALQRTSALIKLPTIGSPSYRMWTRGKRWALNLESAVRRKSILRHAFLETSQEYREIRGFLAQRKLTKIMDIGCGHALIAPLFYRDFGCCIHLVDIERTEGTHHEYEEKGAGYGSLRKAREYMVRNEVPPERITQSNPLTTDVHDENLDLAISLFSCGFHYPTREYAGNVKSWLKPGGLFILDLRNGVDHENFFELFPDYQEIAIFPKSRRIAAFKPQNG